MYVPSNYEQVWVRLTMRITVRIILEAFVYSTKIVRRRLGSLLLYRVTFALRSSKMLHALMTQYTVRMTGIQHISCATKTITTRFQCRNENYSRWGVVRQRSNNFFVGGIFYFSLRIKWLLYHLKTSMPVLMTLFYFIY